MSLKGDDMEKDKDRRLSNDLFSVHDFQIEIDLDVPSSIGKILIILDVFFRNNALL